MEAAFRVINYFDAEILLRRTGNCSPALFLHGAGGMPTRFLFSDQLATCFVLMVPDHPSYGRSPRKFGQT